MASAKDVSYNTVFRRVRVAKDQINIRSKINQFFMCSSRLLQVTMMDSDEHGTDQLMKC